jgi:hypothetical protein
VFLCPGNKPAPDPEDGVAGWVAIEWDGDATNWRGLWLILFPRDKTYPPPGRKEPRPESNPHLLTYLYLGFKRSDSSQVARPTLSPPAPELLPEDTTGSDQSTDAPLAVAIPIEVARRTQPFSQPPSYNPPARPPAPPIHRETPSPTVVGTAGPSVLAETAKLQAVPHTSKPQSHWSADKDPLPKLWINGKMWSGVREGTTGSDQSAGDALAIAVPTAPPFAVGEPTSHQYGQPTSSQNDADDEQTLQPPPQQYPLHSYSRRNKKSPLQKCQAKDCGKPSPGKTFCAPCWNKKSPLQKCQAKGCGQPSPGKTYCYSCGRKKSPLQKCQAKDCGKPSPGKTYCRTCRNKETRGTRAVL